MNDVIEESADAERQRNYWLIAASSHEVNDVIARYNALEKGIKKESAMDAFMSQRAAERAATTEH